MAYEVIILGHLHMPLYFLGTFTEYPYKEFRRYVSVYQDIWLYFILKISYQLIFDS